MRIVQTIVLLCGVVLMVACGAVQSGPDSQVVLSVEAETFSITFTVGGNFSICLLDIVLNLLVSLLLWAKADGNKKTAN